MKQLAINGGKKVRTIPFPAYVTVGEKEKQAIARVIDSGVLSRFLGAWHEDFYGGPEVKAFENEWAKYFGVKHAVAVNSATSGIYAAVGAAGINPGDEVIVSPYSMSASAVAPLIYGGIPVFADIETDYFCLSPASIEARITPLTRAIIVVDIFGQPYDADIINAIAKRHKLILIEDCAQAPGAKYKRRFAGTLADIGIFSLNYHKHIHTGEGGMVVTNDDRLAERVRLIRNHAEAVLSDKPSDTLVNMVGFNYRMTEIEAAIGRVQLKKLNRLLKSRLENIAYLKKKLFSLPCLEPAKVRPQTQPVYYVLTLKYRKRTSGVPRDRFVEAVAAELAPITLRETEGVKIGKGYTRPLYLLPLFQKRIAFGKNGYPWMKPIYSGHVSYNQGICPVAERMYEDELITLGIFQSPLIRKDLNDVIAAFQKVWEYRSELL
ncbi:DegT/DnrJ/EryC1/StrS aminotransferase [Microgenomates group bacterium RIFCSPLOWO2_01_FULL_46_13]|nr:MAG: DegT/DnrJ/EryC1/StrS aminotransferase [Microgenomates group bacterium RIFCSPHIGHO2_01_FULL_45_11]OGV94556.1 MAG: DegT/DnrJ/EryC1/StrS aminotransferase [Microgenomates group bacterium RIFCSPLOWO2_01_FULL_46_13]